MWYACVVLTGGTAGPDGLPEYLGDQLTGGPVNAKGSGMMKGPANLQGERVGGGVSDVVDESWQS